MNSEPIGKIKPAPLSGRKFWRNEKFKELFSGLKKNVLNKSIKTPYPTAIDIGTDNIKFLQLDDASAGAVIKKIGLFNNSLVSLIKENQIQGRISVLLPLSKLEVFSFVLPNMPEKEIAPAIIWKLKQNLPAGTDISSISFDYNWTIYSRNNPNKEICTICFSAPKEKIAQQINIFAEFNLQVTAVEPEPYAVFRALDFSKKILPEETILILNLGAGESSITIAHAGFACLIRPLSVCGKSLTEAIANYHKFDLQKAESIKKSEGLKIQNPADAICMPALSGQLESLVVDAEHSFKFFSHQLMKSQVASFDRVILCGGTAGLKNLDKFLAERFAVPVEVFNPLEGSIFSSSASLSAEVKVNAHSFAAAAGLAIGDLEW